jgi:nitrous oxidase accessory protein NosD
MPVMGRSWQRDRAAIPAVVLLAIALVGPTAAVASAGSPAPSADEPAPGTLQALVDTATPGTVVVIPPGVYREEVTVDKPLTLRGDGAEIRGSDVWPDWRPFGSRWRSERGVPSFSGGGICREPRCAWPEQVFIDGLPLRQVAADPAAGQFSIDADRRVLLADDPTGRRVEVTVRERWLTVEAADVTVEGLTMRHAANPPQHGALQALPGADRLSVRRVRLSDAHGALISFQGVTGASLVSSDLARGGQLGVHAGGEGTTDLTIEGNRIAANNTEGFDPAWEAGGLKAALATNLRVIDNEVVDNDGPGIWCDIGCRDFTASGNRVDSNAGAGIMFEISDRATVEGNVVWENGWGHPTWGWGAGILISSSSGATVRDNLLAWNADGISVISQSRNRPGGDRVVDTTVVDNTVISGAAGGYLLAWLQDWPGTMYAADSRNVGSGNRFWPESTEPTSCRFEWSGCIDRLAAFAETAGGSRSTYLSDEAAKVALAGAGVPAHPIPHSADEPPRLRTVLLVAGVAGLATLALIGAVVVLFRRRDRRRRSSTRRDR